VKNIQTREATPGFKRIEVRRLTGLAAQLSQFIGRAVGVLGFVMLAVLEPPVRFFLMSLATLGILVTIVFGFLFATERFPKWFMLGFSGCCLLILAMFYLAMKAFANLGSH
jgi:hypothetical protein